MLVLAALAAGVLALIHARFVASLPEPVHPPDEPPKTAYAQLFTNKRMAWTFVGCLFFLTIAAPVERSLWPMWVVYVGAVGTLVVVDLFTTYLPIRFHYLCLAEFGLAALYWGLHAEAASIVRAVAGSLIFTGFLWLIWRFGLGLGFGDVRLATIIGFVSAASSWSHFTTALIAGTSIGAIWAIVHTLRGKQGTPFPYGPSLWLGPVCAMLIPIVR